MGKYFAFFKVSLQTSLQYRGRSFIWLTWDVLPPIIMLTFWRAAFAQKGEIAGYTISSMFIYYLLVMFIRAIVFTHPDEVLQREIVSGKIAQFYLTRPANILILKFLFEAAYKFLRLGFLLPLIVIFLLFYPASLHNLTINLCSVLFFFIFIIFTFFLSFLVKFAIGLSTFWFNEIGWLTDFAELLILLFGGTLFPLDFLPKKLYVLSYALPFRFQVFVPTQIFLGRLTIWEFWANFILQIFWFFAFLILVRLLWRRGLKIYSAYGG